MRAEGSAHSNVAIAPVEDAVAVALDSCQSCATWRIIFHTAAIWTPLFVA